MSVQGEPCSLEQYKYNVFPCLRALKVVAPILRVDRPLVGVHVRRTDYINKVGDVLEVLEHAIKP